MKVSIGKRIKNGILTVTIMTSMLAPTYALADNLDVVIPLDEESTITIISMIDSVENKYEWEELFGIEEALDAVSRLEKVHVHRGNIFLSGTLTPDILYEQVIKNNEEFITHNDEEDSYNNFSEEELHKICAQIVSKTNKDLEEGLIQDKEMLGCNLYDLNIFYMNEEDADKVETIDKDFAAVYKNNCIIFIPSRIKDGTDKFDANEEEYKQIIDHEQTHIEQSSCLDYTEKNDASRLGITAYFNDLVANPFDWRFLYESAAQNTADPEKKTWEGKSGVYVRERIYSEILNFSIILNDNLDVNDITKVINNHDLDAFLELFGYKSDEEKYEIINMIESFENNASKYEDETREKLSKEFYGEHTDIIVSDDLYNEIIFNSKISAFKTLTKIFYKNLASKNMNTNISLKDNFFLIRKFELLVLEYVDKKEDTDKENDFYDYYLKVQNMFFSALNKKENIDVESEYYKYPSITDDGYYNCGLDWLNPEKRKFIFDIESISRQDSDQTILTVYQESNRLTR